MMNSKRRLIIVGASGHGKVVADIAKLNGYKDIVFVDDSNVSDCAGYPVIGSTAMINDSDADTFVAIGNGMVRKRIMEEHPDRTFPILVHPEAVVAEDATIGDGTVVMAGAIINPSTIIGKGCILNTSCSVDHDCIVGNYVHVAVGAHICGIVKVGESCWIGAGATISNNIDICSDSLVGAGAVVVKDIKESGTYVGVPAMNIVSNKLSQNGSRFK